MTWSLKGTYFESCNCNVACPCLFLSPPTEGECTALVGWHIEKGDDESVDLSGLNVALAVHSPGHMATTQWNVAVYIDQRATEAQNASLMKIFGGLPPISAQFSASNPCRLTIPSRVESTR